MHTTASYNETLLRERDASNYLKAVPHEQLMLITDFYALRANWIESLGRIPNSAPSRIKLDERRGRNDERMETCTFQAMSL